MHEFQTLHAMKTLLSKILSHSYIPKVFQSYRLTVLKYYCLLLTLSPLLLLSLSLHAQYFEVCSPDKGQVAFIKYFDGMQIKDFIVPDVEQNPFVSLQLNGETINFDLSFINDGDAIAGENSFNQIMEYIEPGIPVEGDLPSNGAYSKDGSIFAVTYQKSDNVIFYDAATYEMLATVQVVSQPINIKMGEEHAYVCCHAGQGIVVISLDDFSITNYIAVDGTPCQVELSPGEDTAYVACDSYRDGWLTAIDLNTNEVIYETHEPYFHHYGWLSGLGRIMYAFTTFKMSPKGDRFISSYTDPIWPAVFDAHTGQLIDTLCYGGHRGAGFSPTGDTLYIYSNHEDSIMLYRYYSFDLTVIDSIKVYADNGFVGIVGYTDLAANADGSKFLVTDAINERYCLFDFNTKTCLLIPESELFHNSPNYSSYDGEYALVGTFLNTRVISLETGQVANSWPAGVGTGLPVFVATTQDKFVGGNFFALFSGTANETIYALDFANVQNITLDTTLVCGELPEADVPINAYLTNDGEKIVVANNLTGNLSIINFEDQHVDTILYIGSMSGIKIIPRTNLAMIYGQGAAKTKIISLDKYELVADLSVGGVKDGFVSSDGQFGYLIQYEGSWSARLTKIKIDEDSSAILDYRHVGGGYCTYHYTNKEIDMTSKSVLSPDDQFILIGCTDPDLGVVLNIISTESLDVLASVPVPESCIYDFAFTEDSRRVIAMGGNTQIPIIYLDGVNSYLENLVNLSFNSFSGCYNPIDGLFYIMEMNNLISKIVPSTGEIVGHENTLQDGNLRIRCDIRGMSMVLTTTSMIYNREIYAMPWVSSELVYDPTYDLFISPVPGPDVICVFDPKMVGIQQFKPGKDQDISIFPNPATEQIFIKSSSEITRVKVCNMAGDEVFAGDFSGKDIDIPTGNLAPGVYVIEVDTKQDIYYRKILVRK